MGVRNAPRATLGQKAILDFLSVVRGRSCADLYFCKLSAVHQPVQRLSSSRRSGRRYRCVRRKWQIHSGDDGGRGRVAIAEPVGAFQYTCCRSLGCYLWYPRSVRASLSERQIVFDPRSRSYSSEVLHSGPDRTRFILWGDGVFHFRRRGRPFRARRRGNYRIPADVVLESQNQPPAPGFWPLTLPPIIIKFAAIGKLAVNCGFTKPYDGPDSRTRAVSIVCL